MLQTLPGTVSVKAGTNGAPPLRAKRVTGSRLSCKYVPEHQELLLKTIFLLSHFRHVRYFKFHVSYEIPLYNANQLFLLFAIGNKLHHSKSLTKGYLPALMASFPLMVISVDYVAFSVPIVFYKPSM